MRTHTHAKAYANCLLMLARQESEDAAQQMTNLYVQKLLYFVQGWALVELNRPAFADPLKAWPHGPVVEELYHEYKQYGASPIASDHACEHDLSPEEADVARMVWHRYKKYSASYLSDMTHRERPWRTARGDLTPSARSNRNLDLDIMKQTFTNKAAHAAERVKQTRSPIGKLAERNSQRMSGRAAV